MEFLGVDLTTIVLSIITVVNLMFASLVRLQSESKSSMFFVITILGVVVWTVGIIFYIQPGINALTFLWSHINYIAAAVFAASFFFFCYYFAEEDRPLPGWIPTSIMGSLIAIIILIIHPGFPAVVVADIVHDARGVQFEIFGQFYFLYILFVLAMFGTGIRILVRKYRETEGLINDQLRYVILGTGFAILLGVTSNIFLPQIGVYGYDFMGPVATLVLVAFISFAITRYQLWDFKIIATQLFLSLMVLILLVQIFLAEGLIDRVIKSLIFSTVIVYGFFLIRGVLKEVALREEAEQITVKLAAANRRLQEVDIEKSDFVSITSHQFRSPLTVIKGYTSMLLEGMFGRLHSKKQIYALEQIFLSSQRLGFTIEEFANISRIEKGEMEYTFRTIDLREVIQNAVNYFRPIIKKEDVSITFRINPGDGFAVEGDYEKLGQVFRNILDNAIKYSPNKGEVIIDIHKINKDQMIQVAITDSGVGIQKEMMQKLFEKFARAESSQRLHTEGRGLGLYIAKQVVEAHGGKIHAESKGRDKGTTFYVELPNPDYVKPRREVKEFLQEV